MHNVSRVLVTGFNGLLGNMIVAKLEKLDVEVICIGNPRSMSASKNEVIDIDLANEWDTRKLPTKVDAILHLAQSSEFRNVPQKALDVFNVNVRSTAVLLDYGHRTNVEKFIYTSTGGVYSPSLNKHTETSPLVEYRDLGFYLGSKAAGEICVGSYKSEFVTQIYRPFFIYGARQKANMLLPRLFNNVKNGNPIQLSGSEGIKVNPIYVADAANAVLSGLDQSNDLLVNLAGPDIFSLKQICDLFGEYLCQEPVYQFVDETASNLVADTTSMRSINYQPKMHLRDYLREIEISAADI